jgi:hypothetical protein
MTASVPLDIATRDGAPTRRRRIAFTTLCVIAALAAAIFMFGIGIIVGWFDTEMHGIHRVHNIGFGILSGVLLTTALVVLARRPQRNVSAFYQVVAVALAIMLAGVFSELGGLVAGGFGVLVVAGILLALHPSRAAVLHAPRDLDVSLLAVVVIGAVPLVAFALTMARLQRTGPPHDPHVSMSHWGFMAAMAFALVLCGALASLRLPGWRVSAWTAGIGIAVYGVASIVFHHFPGGVGPYPGSRGIGWGLVAIAGGVVFVGCAERAARESEGTGGAD